MENGKARFIILNLLKRQIRTTIYHSREIKLFMVYFTGFDYTNLHILSKKIE